MRSQDDIYYARSFARLRASLTTWCRSQTSSLTPEFRDLPSAAVPLFPLTLRQLSHSEVLPLYRENSAFRLAVLQAYISQYLANEVFARRSNADQMGLFLAKVRGFMRREVDFSGLRDEVLQPAIIMAENISSSESGLAVIFFATGSTYDGQIHDAGDQTELLRSDDTFLCLFPALFRKDAELVVVAKSPVSLMTDWTNQDLEFWPLVNPLLFLHSQLQHPPGSGLATIQEDGSTLPRAQLLQRTPTPAHRSETFSIKTKSYGKNVLWWKLSTIALAVLAILLVAALAISLPLVMKRHSRSQFASSGLYTGDQLLSLQGVTLSFTNTTLLNDFPDSSPVSYTIDAQGLATAT